MDNQRTFRLLGFPISIRPGFLLFLLLVVLIYGGTLGIWIAAALAIFTLIHELGHALVARMFGCTARISLDFLAGYAAYIPPRPLRAMERVAIATAGPAVQFAFGMATLLVMGTSPFSRADILASDAATAVWWAGIALALINLFPALPLDGGYVLEGVLETFIGARGRLVAIRVSLVLTIAGVFACVFIDAATQFLPFMVLLVFMQLRFGRNPQTVSPDVIRAKISDISHEVDSSDVSAVGQIAIAYLTNASPAQAVEWAAANWAKYPHPDYALFVAEGLAQSGNVAGATEWIGRAIRSCIDLHSLKHSMSDLPAVAALASTPNVHEMLRSEIERRRS